MPPAEYEARGLEALLDGTQRLPALHVLASFMIALAVGLGLAWALSSEDSLSSAETAAAPSDELLDGGDDASEAQPKPSFDEAIGQLLLRPIPLSALDGGEGEEQLAAARSELKDASLSGIVLVHGDEDLPVSSPRLSEQAESLRRAAIDGGAPPPLVVLAVEGMKDAGYCADAALPGLRDALAATRSETSEESARRLGEIVEPSGIDGLMTTSFKDRSFGCRNGNQANPESLRAGLAQSGIALIPVGTTPEDLSRAGAGGVRFAVAARDDRLSRNGGIDEGRTDGDGPVLLSPDLRRTDGDAPTFGAGDALRAGVDVVLTSDRFPAYRSEVARYFSEPRRDPQLRSSCERMVRFKKDTLGFTGEPSEYCGAPR